VRPGNDCPDIENQAVQPRIGPSASLAPRHRVRVWFGRYKIAEYTAEPALAAQYEAAMRRRFGGLRVTSENLGAPDGRPA
jgi:hypothetical protein